MYKIYVKEKCVYSTTNIFDANLQFSVLKRSSWGEFVRYDKA